MPPAEPNGKIGLGCKFLLDGPGWVGHPAHPLPLPPLPPTRATTALSSSYLGQVQLPARASGTDDQVLGEEEALPLTLLPQGQGAQAPAGDLPLL